MRIANLYDVSFTGKLSSLNVPAHKTFWIEKDNGERFEAEVPNHLKILEAFEWLNDNDSLRHLRNVGPVYKTNITEVENAEHQNAMAEEHAYALGKYSKSYDITTGQMVLNVHANTVPVPERMFTVTWQFWSRDHAVMFKLAMGGSFED